MSYYSIELYGFLPESFDSFDSLLVAEVNFPSFLAFIGSDNVNHITVVIDRVVKPTASYRVVNRA